MNPPIYIHRAPDGTIERCVASALFKLGTQVRDVPGGVEVTTRLEGRRVFKPEGNL